MKLIVFCVFAFVIGAFGAPTDFPGKGHDWSLVPDGDGKLHLVDLNPFTPDERVDVEPEPAFNAEADVIFRVFTRANPTNGQVITLNNAASLSNSNFNSGNPTRFIIHGWNNNGGSTVNVMIRTALLNRAALNVIVVDWGVGAQTLNYINARNNINLVGPVVARFVDFLNLSGGMAFTSVSVIGHSLGGHTAGLTGKNVARGRLHTIVALDPALPLFSIDRPNERVAPTDANYVEIIHTNAGLLGFDLPIGMSDYYPNFGSTQPGCGIDLSGNCAHGRAYEFFAESVTTSVGFWGTLCASYTEITQNRCTSSGARQLMGGEPSTRTARGIYWMETNAASPFARG